MSLSPTLEPSLLSPTDLLEQIELLQKQLTDLHNEVNFLRRRDETLNFSIARHVSGNRIVGLRIRKATPITIKNFMNRFLPMTQRVAGIF